MILRVFSSLNASLVMILWWEQGALYEEVGYMLYGQVYIDSWYTVFGASLAILPSDQGKLQFKYHMQRLPHLNKPKGQDWSLYDHGPFWLLAVQAVEKKGRIYYGQEKKLFVQMCIWKPVWITNVNIAKSNARPQCEYRSQAIQVRLVGQPNTLLAVEQIGDTWTDPSGSQQYIPFCHAWQLRLLLPCLAWELLLGYSGSFPFRCLSHGTLL